MTLFQNLKDSAERRPIQIEPIPPDLLTTEEKNDLFRIVTRIREQIQARIDFWQDLTHHYGPLE
jgi:hypothetical protein